MGNDNGAKKSNNQKFRWRFSHTGALVFLLVFLFAQPTSTNNRGFFFSFLRHNGHNSNINEKLQQQQEEEQQQQFCEPWPNCVLPPRPPKYSTLCKVLDQWSPNDPEIKNRPPSLPPSSFLVPRFNVSVAAEAVLAQRYRQAEVPFLITGVPDLTAAGQKWDREYLRSVFANTIDRDDYKIEESRMTNVEDGKLNNTFLYYSKGKIKGKWKHFERPQILRNDLGYNHFDAMAERVNNLEGYTANTDPLLYTGISANLGGQQDWIRDALPFLVGDGSLDPDPTLFIPFPSNEWKGINCRFGMKGIVQTAHYDGHRNMIAMVKGRKRYIVLPPLSCSNLELFPRGHPSARHASFDWADHRERQAEHRRLLLPNNRNNNNNNAKNNNEPSSFCGTPAVDLVLEEGDVLYLPSFWFHYIVSLDKSVQCNSRSGKGTAGQDIIQQCGF